MAKGKDSEVRTGLKREYAFALKSLTEISESSDNMGRTRSTRPRTVSEEPKGDALDTLHDRSQAVNVKGKNLVSPKKEPFSSEGSVPTLAPAKKFPSTLKELLDTGLLEGQRVRYIKSKKARGCGEPGVWGVIEGSMIACYCNSCNGTQFFSPTLFELHAGSSNKRPPEYIHLDNGNSLRDVINACKDSSLANLEETVKRAIGVSEIEKCRICFVCQGPILEDGTEKSTLFCDSCVHVKDSFPSKVEASDDSIDVFAPESSNSGSKSRSSQSKSQGRITMKDTGLHKLVFKEDVLPDGTELGYCSRGQKTLVGYKKGSGIICTCCNSEVSPSQFEAHAGWAARRKPYLHIYTSNGVSLHELALSLTKDRKSSSNGNDDLCYICRLGQDLVCCSGCPRAFHEQCNNLPTNVGDDPYCKLCRNLFIREKNKKPNADALAAGRVEGIDPIQQISDRCIRIVNTEDIDFGGCALCRGHEFSKSGFDSRTVLICDQCEKEFHVGCLKEHGIQDLKELPEGMWFCSEECLNIDYLLQNAVNQGSKKLPKKMLLYVKKKQNGEDSSERENEELDVKWKLINSRLVHNEETDLLLSQAVSIFRNRFAPIIDPTTERDLIPDMLYGNNITGKDFSRMYSAILTVNQCVVSAAIFRVFGSELAELALVATDADYQGQGYFQALFNCFEGLLDLLNVRNLVLPAAVGAESIWINKFRFSKLPANELNEYKRQYQMTIFQGTSLLRKTVVKC